MRRLTLFLILAFCSLTVFSQENMVSLSGGYVFANMDAFDGKATGWGIDGVFEFNPMEGKIAHGVVIAFKSTKATEESISVDENEYKLSNLPVYYQPKILLGSDKIKVFFEGAVGFHWSKYKRSGFLGDFSSTDVGFYGGLGAGIMKPLGDRTFINIEYQWAWLSNSFYQNGFINSVMGGIGRRF